MLSLHRNLLYLRHTTAFLPRYYIQLHCEKYEMLPGNLYWNRPHHEPEGEVRFAHGELATAPLRKNEACSMNRCTSPLL
jgi:hypothetical protein